MSAHTPTPWKAGRDDMQSYECSEAMTPVTHIYATTVFEPKKHLGHKLPLTIARAEGDNNKADAAYIVTCVNSHDQLLSERNALLATTAKLRELLAELLDARGTSLDIVGHDPVSGHPLSREGMAALKAREALSLPTPSVTP